MMMTITTELSTEAENVTNDSSRMRIAITGKNVPVSVSTAEKPLKTRTGRMTITGVHRNADKYSNTWIRNQRAE
jgi:hypothetical protein